MTQNNQDIAQEALTAILPRLNAMNSFIRSDASRRHALSYGNLARVVYHYKREALIRATNLGIATHRRATVPAKCRDCGGDGKYMDSYGQQHDHCWRCESSGYVRLEFVETTLAAGIAWLTPREKSWGFLRGTDYGVLEETTNNPQINQPGVDLTPAEVAEHMNAIEAFFPARPPTYWGDDREWDPFSTYTIWIGTTPLGRCYLCAAPMERIYGGHAVRSGRVIWNGLVCKACEDASRESVFTRLAPLTPREFITPSVAEWIARHPVPIQMHNDAAHMSRSVEVVEAYPAAERDDDSDIPF